MISDSVLQGWGEITFLSCEPPGLWGYAPAAGATHTEMAGTGSEAEGQLDPRAASSVTPGVMETHPSPHEDLAGPLLILHYEGVCSGPLTQQDPLGPQV